MGLAIRAKTMLANGAVNGVGAHAIDFVERHVTSATGTHDGGIKYTSSIAQWLQPLA